MINSPKNKISGKNSQEDFFGKKGYLSRLELREKLRRAPSKIPGSRKWYSRQERINMEKELFGEEYGSYISPQECRRRLQELEREKFRAKTNKEKLKIDEKIRYLKGLTGF